jgi:hypothetical protein
MTATQSSIRPSPVSLGKMASTRRPCCSKIQEGDDVAVATAGQAIRMLDEQHAHLRIAQQLLELGPLVVQAGGNLRHFRHDLIAARGRVVLQALQLAARVVFLVCAGHPRVEGTPCTGATGSRTMMVPVGSW